uniref:UBZ4-type domain-containing protein n=1 Tax=Spongospora subterranea TaxID=70186 RepID=A0A0H5RA93_9EUKA|eukprot:CRZ05339.1 hypothetical protein [Spongospora subterranea]
MRKVLSATVTPPSTKSRTPLRPSPFVKCPACGKSVVTINMDDHLDRRCTVLNVRNITDNDDHENQAISNDNTEAGSVGNFSTTPRSRLLKPPDGSLPQSQPASRASPFVLCPFCQKSVVAIHIDDHLDRKCLSRHKEVDCDAATAVGAQDEDDSISSHSCDADPVIDPTKPSTPSFSQRSYCDALKPQPAIAFSRKGKRPIAYSQEWHWTQDDCGIWNLDFQLHATNGPAVNRSPSPEMSFSCFMLADDRSPSPVRVAVTFTCPGLPFESSDHKLTVNRPVSRSYRFAPSFLKSLLQKSVRLCRPWGAVRASLQLIRRAGLTEFLRRLTIIMVEDAVVHPALPWLVSLTIATSKGYRPPNSCVSLCLQLVYEIAAVKVRDVAVFGDGTVCVDLRTDLSSLGLTTTQCAIVQALLLRAQLGGMNCDVKMLRQSAQIWTQRFTTSRFSIDVTQDERFAFCEVIADANYRPYSMADVAVDVILVEGLDDEDLILSSVDHHCSDVADVLILRPSVRAVLPEASIDIALRLLHTVIWRCSSSLSNKGDMFDSKTGVIDNTVPAMLEKIFEAIRKDFYDFAIEFISARRSISSTR